MDLQKFRKRLKEYRSRIGISQEDLADGAHVNKSVLSEALNGRQPLSVELVHGIIHYLAEEQAIRGQSQVFELLKLTDTEDFSEADWKSPPFVDLVPEPSPIAPPHQLLQDEISQAPSGKTAPSAEDLVNEQQDDGLQINKPIQAEEQAIAAPETSEEQALLLDQKNDVSHESSPASSHLQDTLLSPKDRLEAAYQQLWNVSEARFQFAGVVEALRKIRGEVAYETLPRVKQELEDAELAFHEKEARQVLRFLDNNKVWPHYMLGTAAYEKYKERTKKLVEEALEARSRLTHPVLKFDALLAGDHWKDDDPQTRKLYEEMEREFNAMLKAMNRRLRV